MKAFSDFSNFLSHRFAVNRRKDEKWDLVGPQEGCLLGIFFFFFANWFILYSRVNIFSICLL